MNYDNTNFLLALKHGFYYMRGSLFSKIFCSTLWQRTDTNIERNGSNLVSVPAKKWEVSFVVVIIFQERNLSYCKFSRR